MVVYFGFFIVCFSMVKVVEVGDNDWYRQGNGQYVGNGIQRVYYFVIYGDGRYVFIVNCGYGDYCLLEGFRDVGEMGVCSVGFGKVDCVGEEDYINEEEEDEEVQFTYGGSQCLV